MKVLTFISRITFVVLIVFICRPQYFGKATQLLTYSDTGPVHDHASCMPYSGRIKPVFY